MVDDHNAMIYAEAAGLPEPAKKLPPRGKMRQESSSYLTYESELDMTGITYRIKLKDVHKVEAIYPSQCLSGILKKSVSYLSSMDVVSELMSNFCTLNVNGEEASDPILCS